MKRMLIGLAALLAATPAAAEPLWQNVETGMSVAQLRALYPAGGKVRHRPDRLTISDFAIIPECSADVHILHRGGSVEAVVVRGEPAIFARCGAALLEALKAEHGEPLSAETSRPSILKRVRTTFHWHKDGLHLRFVRFATEGWGGAGLGNASWEMSLSRSPEAPTL